ncbi:MAG: hypothetical protein IT518_14475 [Burkholderiales bacterium]|nr:hypothetical protein [Burkholderiales bacterium]
MADDSPADTTRSRVTLLLAAARDGDTEAASAAYAMLCHELRQLARAKLRRHRAMTLLDTTSLRAISYERAEPER